MIQLSATSHNGRPAHGLGWSVSAVCGETQGGGAISASLVPEYCLVTPEQQTLGLCHCFRKAQRLIFYSVLEPADVPTHRWTV